MLMFGALALPQRESSFRCDKGLKLETSAFNLFTVAILLSQILLNPIFLYQYY